MIGIPIDLGPVPSMQQIFDGEPVQFLVVAKRPNDIPREAIHIYPPTSCPLFPGFVKKGLQIPVIELMLFNTIFREVDSCDSALLHGNQ